MLRAVVMLLVLSVISSCTGTPQAPAATATATSRPEPTALPTLDGWTQTSTPITLETVPRVQVVGRLNPPEPPSTLFSHALSLDNAMLAGLNNDFLLVWDLLTGETVLASDRRSANVVLFGPDREHVYTLSADGTIRIYETGRGGEIETLTAVEGYNGAWAYDPVGGWLALAGDAGVTQVWDMLAPAVVQMLESDGAPLSALAFSPDGATLATANRNGTIVLWDVAAGTQLATANLMTPVTEAVYSPSGDALVVSTGDGVLSLEPGSAQVTARLTDAPNTGVFGVLGERDLLMLGGEAADLTIWDIAAGRLAATLPGTAGPRPSAAASPDGQMVLTTTREGTSLWNVSGLANGTVLRGSIALPALDIVRTVWTADGLQILLFEAIGPVHVLGVR